MKPVEQTDATINYDNGILHLLPQSLNLVKLGLINHSGGSEILFSSALLSIDGRIHFKFKGRNILCVLIFFSYDVSMRSYYGESAKLDGSLFFHWLQLSV